MRKAKIELYSAYLKETLSKNVIIHALKVKISHEICCRKCKIDNSKLYSRFILPVFSSVGFMVAELKTNQRLIEKKRFCCFIEKT